MKKIGFSLICMLVLLFSFQGIKAQQVFSSGSAQGYDFNEYTFSETTPSDLGIKEISNSLLQDDSKNNVNEDPGWNPGDPDSGNTGEIGSGQGVGVGSVPIGDGLWLLLFSGIAYGAIIFIRRQQQCANNKEIK